MPAAVLNSDKRLLSTAMVVLPSVVKWKNHDARLSGISTSTIVRGFWSSGKRMLRAKNAASSADVANNLVSIVPALGLKPKRNISSYSASDTAL